MHTGTLYRGTHTGPLQTDIYTGTLPCEDWTSADTSQAVPRQGTISCSETRGSLVCHCLDFRSITSRSVRINSSFLKPFSLWCIFRASPAEPKAGAYAVACRDIFLVSMCQAIKVCVCANTGPACHRDISGTEREDGERVASSTWCTKMVACFYINDEQRMEVSVWECGTSGY